MLRLLRDLPIRRKLMLISTIISAAAMMRKAVAGFISRLPVRVNSLLALGASANVEELQRMIHQLKGAGASYGFPSITQTAARAEANIKTFADVDAIRAGVNSCGTSPVTIDEWKDQQCLERREAPAPKRTYNPR